MATENQTEMKNAPKYETMGYHVFNFYKGCHKDKHFENKKKFLAYMNRQRMLDHDNIVSATYGFWEQKHTDWTDCTDYDGYKIFYITLDSPYTASDGTVIIPDNRKAQRCI